MISSFEKKKKKNELLKSEEKEHVDWYKYKKKKKKPQRLKWGKKDRIKSKNPNFKMLLTKRQVEQDMRGFSFDFF